MKDNERTAELIQRYLEERCSEVELAALESLVMHDPHAAEALADAVRVDTGLAMIFGVQRRTADLLARLSETQPLGDDGGVSPHTQVSVGEDSRPSAVEPAHSAAARPGRRVTWWIAAALLLAVGVPLARQFTGHGRTSRAPESAAWSQVLSGDVLVDGVPAQEVREGATVRVVGDKPAVIRLTDGSQAEFEPGTSAVLQGGAVGLRQWIELHAGSGTFRVEQGDGEFQVETQLGRVTALGTEFSVRLQPPPRQGETTMNVRSAVLAVAVLSGVVQVEAGGQISVLGRGESRVFAQGRGGPARSAPLRGPLVSIGNGQITVGGRGGSTVHALGPHVAVTIDGKRAKIEELGVGMIVSLERRDGEGPVVGIKAEGPTIGGEVKAIDADQRTVTLAKRGDGPRGTPEQTFSFAPGVAVTLDGQPASASDLQPGASVALKLTVDKKTVLSITGSRGREEGPKTGDRGP